MNTVQPEDIIAVISGFILFMLGWALGAWRISRKSTRNRLRY